MRSGSCSPAFGSSSVIPYHIQPVMMELKLLDGIIHLQLFHPLPQLLTRHPYPLVALHRCLCFLFLVGLPRRHLRFVGYITLSLLYFPMCLLLECPLLLLLPLFLPHSLYLHFLIVFWIYHSWGYDTQVSYLHYGGLYFHSWGSGALGGVVIILNGGVIVVFKYKVFFELRINGVKFLYSFNHWYRHGYRA